MRNLNEVGKDIFGFDVSDFSHCEHPRFSFVRGDCGTPEDLLRIANSAPYFDVVIDDASHASFHQQTALKTLFPRVARGGLYIIEDLHWQSPFFEDALEKIPKTADFFMKFLKEGTYLENPVFSHREMTEFKARLQSFSIFPDFIAGGQLKMLVLRVQ